MQNTEARHNSAKLNWACRRGMLELDEILQRFLRQAYSGLTAAQKTQFAALLNCSDQELYSWLILNKDFKRDELTDIIQIIRETLHNEGLYHEKRTDGSENQHQN
ncbi:MAG: succinate dehydrogenase assembly factor 2 [Pseudomonadota bacterium]